MDFFFYIAILNDHISLPNVFDKPESSFVDPTCIFLVFIEAISLCNRIIWFYGKVTDREL